MAAQSLFPAGALSLAIAEAVARARANPGRVVYVIESFNAFPPLVPRLNASPVFVTLGYRVTVRAPVVEKIAPILEGSTCHSVAARVVFAAGGGAPVCQVHTERQGGFDGSGFACVR